jgi:hypothetical protein
MAGVMLPRTPFEVPESAAYAWARYRRLMRFMVVVTLTVIVFAFTMLYRANGLVSIHLYIATALGIGFAMLLMSVLMGLVFLSSNSGHDEAVLKLDDEGEQPGAQD